MRDEPCENERFFKKYPPEYAAYVAELRRGLARLRLVPQLASLYSLSEIDMILTIQAWEYRREKEEQAKWLNPSS